MKVGYLAVAAAMAVGVLAKGHDHGHVAFHNGRGLSTAPASNCTCGSYTSWVTTYAEMTLHNPPPPPPPSTSAPPPPAPTSSVGPPVAPTPMVTTCPTPGIYTIPATTLTVTSSITVCAATSTSVPAGTYTVGGVTTVVLTSTTVVCPVATTTTLSGGEVTSTIITTTYVCPSAGTYTIAPITTTCTSPGTIVYPVPSSYGPGTYTQPEVVTTITETDYVIFCPFTSNSPPAATSAAPVAPNVVAAATSSSPAQPAQSSSGAPFANNGNQWAITYTPYQPSNGLCKDASDVLADITAIKAKGFTTIRMYSTDCSGLENVGAACQAVGLRMIIGIFIDNTGISGAQSQVTDIVSWAQWSLVDLIVIGNEAIFGGYCSASDLASFISSCKSTFQQAGYSGPCTTTEPLSTLQDNQAVICEVVDVVGANMHAFFNGGIDASGAGDFICNNQLTQLQALCPGKTVINLETGWPSQGPCNGVACTGDANQQIAIQGIMETCGNSAVLFSYFDDMWKQGEWEQYFGCGQLFN